MNVLAESRRKLAKVIEEENDRDQGVNHNIPAILYRDAREMDRLQAHIDALQAQEDRKDVEIKRLNEEIEANANRIVACVNGCAGINPEAVAIKKARGEL